MFPIFSYVCVCVCVYLLCVGCVTNVFRTVVCLKWVLEVCSQLSVFESSFVD